MAKWGEGDDRWLVQDRADGANVNSWHWVEKDCLEWSRQRLQELFNDMKLLDAGDLTASTTGVKSLTGEAFLNTRKAKIIASYELELKVGWTGSTANGEEETGVAHFPYIAEENHDEEPDMRIICESETPLAQRLKQSILSQAKGKLQAAVGQYVQEMRAGKPVDAVADAQDGRKQAAASSAPAPAPAAEAPKPEPSSKAGKKAKARGRMLELKQQFYASPADIYDCLLNANRIKAFTQSDAKVDARPGGEFTMFGGSITGTVVELEQNARIVQDWRFNSWEAGVVSRVEIVLAAPVPGTTELTLKQTGIPEEDAFGNADILPMVESGWQQQIFLRIKAVFGYGV